MKNTIEPVVERKWKDAQEKNTSYVGAILSIKVLDPAMGSGHFLVGAVDFLSQKLMEAMLKDSEAGRIMDAGSYTNDWARREIVSHCIYGVDLNEYLLWSRQSRTLAYYNKQRQNPFPSLITVSSMGIV